MWLLLTSLCFPGDVSNKRNQVPMQEIWDMGSVPGLGTSPGGGYGNPFNPMDRGAWQAIVHRVTKWKVKVKVIQSRSTLCDPGILQARILEWVAFHFSRDLPNPGLLHCWWILCQLSFKGSPRILEWVAYHFSRGSSWLRHWTGVSCIAGRFFTNWAMRVAKSQIQLKWLSTHAWAI